MITWGITLLCHVPVKDKGGIYTARFFLGLVRILAHIWRYLWGYY